MHFFQTFWSQDMLTLFLLVHCLDASIIQKCILNFHLLHPIAKKIFSKKTRNEKYMDQCLLTNLCSMMGMFTFVILFFISKGIRVQIHTTNSFVFEFIV